LSFIDRSYNKAISELNNYYENLIQEKRLETGPKGIIKIISLIYNYWKNNWVEEFFSDLFTCFFLGPSHVWAHYFLFVKKIKHLRIS